MPTYYCSLCAFSSDRKYDYTEHLRTLKHQQKIEELEEAKIRIEEETKSDTIHELQQRVQQLTDQNKDLKARLEKKDIELENKDALIANQTSLLRAAVTRPTTVTRTTNNNLNLLSAEPIDWAGLKRRVPELVTVESLMTNERKFNRGVTNALLVDGEGNPKVVCTDRSRKNFQYRDEVSGELISDPCLERLREKLKAGVNYKQLYRELLEHLDDMGGDKSQNGEEAHRILKRARFEQSFVNYVAKRMYSRSLATIKFVE